MGACAMISTVTTNLTSEARQARLRKSRRNVAAASSPSTSGAVVVAAVSPFASGAVDPSAQWQTAASAMHTTGAIVTTNNVW